MTDERRAGGPALKQAIHVARARAEITSDVQLALKAGVSYDTLMNWFSDRTTPRPAELKKVADALDVRLVELMDAWDGREPQPPELEDAIRELVAEIRLDRQRRSEVVTVALAGIARALESVGTQYVRDANGDGTANNGPSVTEW
jgi:transcriptional regulator with XRE-family HTH domain